MIKFTAAYGFVVFPPLSIGLAILRSRLWDIDVLINRTLVYGCLSVCVVGVYVLVVGSLDYLLSLAEAALAEMRALIFELRPESSEREGLVAALAKQGAALQARHDITVQTDLCEEPTLPLKVKQELYRVAQEALHNTVKHAQASKVDLVLCRTADAVILEVRDDGVGFDPQGSFPGHLGLHSMQERVSHLGGSLQIENAPGQGTHLLAQVPLGKQDGG